MLRGKRVVLRSVEREDLPTLCAFNNDLELEVVGGGDPPLPQSLARLQAEYDSNVSKGGRDDPWFAIEVEGKMIGQVALHGFQDVHRTCELGIGIGDKAYWGQGYGREVVLLLLDWAFRYRNLNRVWLTTISSNVRAYRCYLACGFVEEGRQRQHLWGAGHYEDLIYMGILRSEWEEQNSPEKTES